MAVTDFDPFSTDTIENPYPFYEALREEAPLFKPKGADCYYLSRYDDIKQVAMDPEQRLPVKVHPKKNTIVHDPRAKVLGPSDGMT